MHTLNESMCDSFIWRSVTVAATVQFIIRIYHKHRLQTSCLQPWKWICMLILFFAFPLKKFFFIYVSLYQKTLCSCCHLQSHSFLMFSCHLVVYTPRVYFVGSFLFLFDVLPVLLIPWTLFIQFVLLWPTQLIMRQDQLLFSPAMLQLVQNAFCFGCNVFILFWCDLSSIEVSNLFTCLWFGQNRVTVFFSIKVLLPLVNHDDRWRDVYTDC